MLINQDTNRSHIMQCFKIDKGGKVFGHCHIGSVFDFIIVLSPPVPIENNEPLNGFEHIHCDAFNTKYNSETSTTATILTGI